MWDEYHAAATQTRIMLQSTASSHTAMSLPSGYSIRPVKLSDLRNYVDVLAVLTTVGDITSENFSNLVEHWNKHGDFYFPRVIVDAEDTVVATGMLLVERKLIHGCGKVGHVEDIAVSKGQQGNRLGWHLISHLSALAKDNGCYKVILDCSPENVAFYEKCGYKNAGIQMSKRFD